ncbi:hypothetical protein [Lonepinella sp. BR2271]|uniref:hypothetical protein n=1 Tax=Lonepinella sp. BR2271 TaxID=3434550 RepID=UPI003F6E3DF3
MLIELPKRYEQHLTQLAAQSGQTNSEYLVALLDHALKMRSYVDVLTPKKTQPQDSLMAVQGLLKHRHIDGLAYQNQLRDEWE